MKSVLRSAKPYWIYLILTGRKTVEVGKDFPKSADWNKVVEMYCSKDKRSFNRIPENDRKWMSRYLGKVACQFVCDEMTTLNYDTDWGVEPPQEGYFFVKTPTEHVLLDFNPCLTNKEMIDYGKGKPLYAWHISDLKIYDKPKELGEFNAICPYKKSDGTRMNVDCPCDKYTWDFDEKSKKLYCTRRITRPPQSWQFIEQL